MFGKFDGHVVFQRCKIFKVTSKMAAITGWGITWFLLGCTTRKKNRLLFFVMVMLFLFALW